MELVCRLGLIGYLDIHLFRLVIIKEEEVWL